MSTITADPTPVFPACPTYGFTSEPNLLCKITPREGGFEKVQRVWDQFLMRYTAVPLGEQHQADLEEVYNFWMALGSFSGPFRFLDQLDHKSCALDAEPAATDQPLLQKSGSDYYLIKEYTAGTIVHSRFIQRPIGSTIQIANEVGDVQTDWTLDESSGLLTIGGGFSGTPGFWGGEFHVWCRFATQLALTFSNFKILTGSIQLQQKRQPLA